MTKGNEGKGKQEKQLSQQETFQDSQNFFLSITQTILKSLHKPSTVYTCKK